MYKQKWTIEQDNILRQMRREGATFKEIAKRLNKKLTTLWGYFIEQHTIMRNEYGYQLFLDKVRILEASKEVKRKAVNKLIKNNTFRNAKYIEEPELSFTQYEIGKEMQKSGASLKDIANRFGITIKKANEIFNLFPESMG